MATMARIAPRRIDNGYEGTQVPSSRRRMRLSR